MDWTQPVSLTLGEGMNPLKRIAVYFGHYDTRVYMTDTAYIDIGAGSLETLNNLSNTPTHVGSMGAIGRFCEMAPTAQIFVRAEHENDKPVNICFTGMPVLGDYFNDQALKPLKPVSIGNGVVVSAGARILSGVAVGDGAVIGASSVLTRPAEALGIYAGAPARLLRRRAPFLPWWDFSAAYIAANKEHLQALSAPGVIGQDYRVVRPRFVLRDLGAGIQLAGFQDGDVERPFTQAPPLVQRYVEQFIEEATPVWLADCWA